MTEHDPALVEKAARAIACGWCHATNHEQCREWNKPVDTLHSTRLYDARAVLDAVAPAIREAALHEAADELADIERIGDSYIQTGDQLPRYMRHPLGDVLARIDGPESWEVRPIIVQWLRDRAAQQREEQG